MCCCLIIVVFFLVVLALIFLYCLTQMCRDKDKCQDKSEHKDKCQNKSNQKDRDKSDQEDRDKSNQEGRDKSDQEDRDKCHDEDTIVFVFDQMIAWHKLPDEIVKDLKGYQAFKKIGVEFTNIYTNRQLCTSSRGSFFTSFINTGLQDDIQEHYQYESVPFLNPNFDTIGKSYKKKGFTTAFYGKSHMDARLYSEYTKIPCFYMNTRGVMKSYGFDTYNTYGDTAAKSGIIGDNREFECIMPITETEYDYFDGKNKLNGLIPFLQARKKDNKNFHVQFHSAITHDTMQFYQNTSQVPSCPQFQFINPYYKEQFSETGYYNPYFFDENFPDAYYKSEFLTKNYFEDYYNEDTYEKYCTKIDSLPFTESFLFNYPTNPKFNTILPFYAGAFQGLTNLFSMNNDQYDIKSCKNLVNNYYGLALEADVYLYRLYKYLEKNDKLKTTTVIITTDHGEELLPLKEKGFPNDNSLNVPFMICSSKLNKELLGTKSNVLGSLLDLNPTLEVISNLEKNENFLGKSLVEYSKNGLIPRNDNISPLHVGNSTMIYLILYSGWLEWIKNQSEETKSLCLNTSTNAFKFHYNFLTTVKYINGKKYKFTRFFNLYELYNYNFHNNEKLRKFKFFDSGFIEYAKENGYEQLLPLDDLSFAEAFEYLDEYGQKLFMKYVNSMLLPILSNLYTLPGFLYSYQEMKNNENYVFICWNLTDDPNELVNLADPRHQERHDDELFEELNRQINEDIVKYKMQEFFFISPMNSEKILRILEY